MPPSFRAMLAVSLAEAMFLSDAQHLGTFARKQQRRCPTVTHALAQGSDRHRRYRNLVLETHATSLMVHGRQRVPVEVLLVVWLNVYFESRASTRTTAL